MEDVLPVVAAEVWGDVGEEKEAGAFAGGCKEAKHVRAFATYQLLAAGTTFRTHFGPLLGLVRALLRVAGVQTRKQSQQLHGSGQHFSAFRSVFL